MPMSLDIDPLDLVDPTRFALHGRPHQVWARLRAEAPVAYIEPPGHPPFWAVTRHADLCTSAIATPALLQRQGITLDMDLTGSRMPAEMIVYLDPPAHGPCARWPTRSSCAARSGPARGDRADRRRHRRRGLDRWRDRRSATSWTPLPPRYPVAVISWVLGVPPADWEHHFRWTNEIIGKDDPEYRLPGESPGRDLHAGPGRAAPVLQGHGQGPPPASPGRPGDPAGAERDRRGARSPSHS